MDDAATPKAPATEATLPQPDSAEWDDQVDEALANWDAEEADPEDQAEPEAEEAKDPEVESDDETEGEAEAEAGGESAPDTSDPGEAKVKVKVRGEEREVALSEALAGYSRTEDYKAKTSELAREREEFQAAANQEWQRIQELSQSVISGMETDPVIAEWNNADKRDLLEYDPDRYHQLKAAHDERMEWYQGLFAQQNEVAQQAQQQFQQQQQEYARQEAQALAEKWPEWGDPANGAETAKALHGTLTAYGFNPQELQEMVDHRMYLVARDAMKWRQHQAALKSAGAKKAPPATAVKPKGEGPKRPSRKVTALRNKAFRTDSPRDVAEYADALDWED